ncbi:UDP-N-acetylglucosamine/UDP-N-acetylgalactosaminediphosphorylase [Pseudobutyrivibrio sp. ACV-2]|uniref:UTP--glucose-1-phosphate uridylyltransferase n=1 Tax=Pseudobutyrivibrio sp. ACV-2 TaxID=1520801 RepID=UPI00089C813F|nr:UDPGP type 1 family protein [Pseudobutyrivibrio sp. ACV-2]SEA00270.1 UDP-N-acetylglucosamine/UDP-N-acetylgalactosaminediphosphorylase [Pseudobutyrivibrio sp. ACV-2]
MNKEEAIELLEKAGQGHVMNGFDNLSDEKKESLLAQIENINWSDFKLIGNDSADVRGEFAVPPAIELPEIEARKAEFEAAGLEAIKKGEVGAVLLAGGMGTRLGFDLPKGCYNVGQTHELFIFECLINNLMDVVKKADAFVPLYIMTSEKNDEATQAFFKEHNYFGYNPEYVKFFIQDMACAVDYDGKLLLEEEGRLATSPNGNGGWYASMLKAGLKGDIEAKGLKWINVFAVDNVLQRIADPLFIGATILGGYVSGSKVVRKVEPAEKMGLLCLEDGKPSIVEYYEMSKEMSEAKAEDGSLLYKYGVILNYLFAVEKLDEIVDNNMVVHVVEKKIPYINENGEKISPTEPNGYKFELLVLDMIHMMDNNLAFEVDRVHEFAPIKNLHGVDSVDSARELLQQNGVVL